MRISIAGALLLFIATLGAVPFGGSAVAQACVEDSNGRVVCGEAVDPYRRDRGYRGGGPGQCPPGSHWADRSYTQCVPDRDQGYRGGRGGQCPPGHHWADRSYTKCVPDRDQGYRGGGRGGQCPPGYHWADRSYTKCVPDR
jgi:hypothetical protein